MMVRIRSFYRCILSLRVVFILHCIMHVMYVKLHVHDMYMYVCNKYNVCHVCVHIHDICTTTSAASYILGMLIKKIELTRYQVHVCKSSRVEKLQ
jgi:hypothetical protein